MILMMRLQRMVGCTLLCDVPPVLLEVAEPFIEPLTLTESETLPTAPPQEKLPPPVVVLLVAKLVVPVEPLSVPLTETFDVIEGISLAARACIPSPPAPPRVLRSEVMPLPESLPESAPPILSGDATTRPRRSGRLNVVAPSPAP